MTLREKSAEISPPLVRRFWLTASIVFNIILAAGLIATLGSHNSLPGPTAPDARNTDASTEPRELERILLASGLNTMQARRAVLALIQMRESIKEPYQYWRPEFARRATERIAAFERDERVRSALLRAFGPSARDDLAFTSVFRPMERQLPMLSAEQQLRLQKVSIDRLKGMTRTAVSIGPLTGVADVLLDELTGAERFEYEVRESPLARALTASGFDFTQKEFRHIFRVISARYPRAVTATTPASLAEIISDGGIVRDLAAALEPARFESFLRLRDPVYRILRRIAQMRGISNDAIAQAYELLVSEHPGLSEGPQATERAGSGASVKLDATTVRSLESLLGRSIASEVARALSLYQESFGPGRSVPRMRSLLPGDPIQIPGVGSEP